MELAGYGAMVGADFTQEYYARFVELAEELDLVGTVPTLDALTVRGEGAAPVERWLEETGLWHSGRRWCRGRGGAHWCYQCSA